MDQNSELPTSVKALVGLLAAGCLVGVANMINPKAMWIVLIGLLVVALIFGLYLLVVFLLKRRKAASMGGDLTEHGSLSPRGISDPAHRAKLDDLRRKFQDGLATFRSAGKDIYALPWYLVIGESGAGKTEAIRHCNVGFPPGLQDEMQGIGGTINMNWWFTNNAVILDTAGKMVFPEVGAATTREWDEFLGMLKRSRKNCPINGLILVLPSDSLIKDNADEVAKKAGRIVDQLNKIQRSLDVRFPVFVVITKCDLINGFREFFNNLTDPQLQHQMLGWSNPTPLDDTFKPELVDQHFQSVIQRIRRRRMGLLQYPAQPSDSGDSRRIDEIDSLFSLPASIELLTPRLRRYLEVVFTPNQWGGKPLFLRGIYFASSMREGSALDADLAEAIGVSVDSLPEGKNWERERSYFLRDLFVEKIFKERGLVTGASNTRWMLRRRQAMLFGCGFLGLFLLFGFSWFGSKALRESVGRETDYWQAASSGWQAGPWWPIVSPELKGSLNYVFNGAQEIKVGSDSIRLDEFHRKLAELTKADIQVPWVFKPLNQVVVDANTSRKGAQRTVFECGVVAPLVQAARNKVEQSSDNWTPASTEALAFLIHLEGMIANRAGGLTAEELSGVNFLKPLSAFLYNDPKPPAALVEAFDWVYFKGGAGRGDFPPRWLSAGFSLKGNRYVSTGFDAFIKHTLESQKAQATGFERIKAVRAELRALKRTEDDLNRLAAQPAVVGGAFANGCEAAVAAYIRRKDAVDQALSLAGQGGVAQTSMFEAYKTLVEESRKQTEGAFKLIQAEIDRFPPSAETSDEKGAAYTLATDVRRQLFAVQQELKSKTEGSFSADELSELQALDSLFLEKNSAGVPVSDSRVLAYAARAAGYQESVSQLRDGLAATDRLVGGFGPAYRNVLSGIASTREKVGNYQGAYAPEFAVITRRILGLAEASRPAALYDRYFSEVTTRLQQGLGFPLVRGGQPMQVAGVRDMDKFLKSLREDLTAIRAMQAPAQYATKAEALDVRVQGLSAIMGAVLADDGRPAAVTLVIPGQKEQRRRLAMQFGTENFGASSVSNLWRVMRVGNLQKRTEDKAAVDMVRFPVSDGSVRIDFFRNVGDSEPDRLFAYNSPWAVLQLIQAPASRRLPGGKNWEILVSLKDANGQERFLPLELQFERALPEIDLWPTVAQMGLAKP
jgi:hypothetical protein